MTLDEVYEIWKTRTYKGLICEHGGLEGGPGFLDFGECDLHSEIRYGGKACPKNCKDFCESSESRKYSIFLALYKQRKSYYDNRYNISKPAEEDRPAYPDNLQSFIDRHITD